MRSTTLRTTLLALALVTVSHAQGRAQHADGDELTRRARAHFEAGRALYGLGNYGEALREFLAGYQLVEKPRFLINLGQTYRKLNELTKAREMYSKYLAEVPPNDPDRHRVSQLIVEIDRTLSEHPELASPTRAQTSPIEPRAPADAEVAAPPEAAPPPARSVPAAALTATRPAPPPQKSFLARNWWILPVAGVVVAGAAVGVYFLARGSNQVDCTVGFGCLDASRP